MDSLSSTDGRGITQKEHVELATPFTKQINKVLKLWIKTVKLNVITLNYHPGYYSEYPEGWMEDFEYCVEIDYDFEMIRIKTL